jgi:outer membrane receptor protein involved in Fe transport
LFLFFFMANTLVVSSPVIPKHNNFFQFLSSVFLMSAGFSAFADQASEQAGDAAPLEEVVVTSLRREQAVSAHAGNIAQVDIETLDWLAAQHIHEVMNRVAGGWVVRGSGQEHQTAIRSPVLGGGGACGGILPLEDGIPVRPPGFCNINLFIELFSEEAQSVEVIRGPGNALYGSNALHGTVNVLMPMPGGRTSPHLELEVGANSFWRTSVQLPLDDESPWLVAATYADDGGFREESGYKQGKLHFKYRWQNDESDFILGFTATDLDQNSAGFITGKDAYKDPEINRTNPDPDAFRDATSQRLYGIYTRRVGHFDLDVRPYLRNSEMSFLHFERPGQPVEDNGQHSAGFISSLTYQADKSLVIWGLDLDVSDAYLRQTQFGPTPGNPRQRETFPDGKHYDYQVDAINIGAYVQAEWWLSEKLSIGGGLRLEYSHYDYDNRMLDGNTRDDGTPCGFGGCVYSRPADRSDDFTDLAPNVSATLGLTESSNLFFNLARGLRVPQMLELYRLQFGQVINDQDTETLDSLEMGVRSLGENWNLEFSAYAMRKRDSAFRDSEGFNVSGGKSKHHGLELLLDWQFLPNWMLHFNGAYGVHQYDFDATGRGETFVSGNDMDSAPRWLGSAEVRYDPDAPVQLGLQVVSLDEYYLDSLNRFTYPGHTLLNLRASWQASNTIEVYARLYNLTDEAIADRADHGMGNYRYLPGRGRELFLEVRYVPD